MAPEQGILAEIIDLNEEPLPGDPDPTLYLGGGHGSWILGHIYIYIYIYTSVNPRISILVLDEAEGSDAELVMP